jgi:hypothetical protein
VRRSPQYRDNRNQEALYLRRKGFTLERIGKVLCVGRERARQLANLGEAQEWQRRLSRVSLDDPAFDIKVFDDFCRGLGYKALQSKYGLSQPHLRAIIHQEALLHGLPCPSITEGQPYHRPAIIDDLYNGAGWKLGQKEKYHFPK